MQSETEYRNPNMSSSVETESEARSENQVGDTANPVAGNQVGDTADSAPPLVRIPVEVDTTNVASIPEPSDAALQLAEDLRKFQKVAHDILQNLIPAVDFDQRCHQIFNLANDLFGHAPTWVCFFREVMATDGLARRLFPSEEEFAEFMKTSQFDQISQMLTGLRSRDLPENDPNDPQRMITVRLPKSLHEALCDEAGKLNMSVNKLCISRLLQVLDMKMVPETVSKPRGRKPRARNNASTSFQMDSRFNQQELP